MYQSLESLSKTVTSPSHSSHSDHQRFPTPLPKSRVVVVVFEMLINYSELQVFVWWSCLCSAFYANAPKFTSCFLCCHICFKVWACLIVHYSMPIFIQIFLLEIILQISLDGPQYSDGLRFPTQSPYSWPNLGLEWSICSKSRVASSCLPGMMNIHSSIRKYVFSSPQQIYSQLKKLIPGVGK